METLFLILFFWLIAGLFWNTSLWGKTTIYLMRKQNKRALSEWTQPIWGLHFFSQEQPMQNDRQMPTLPHWHVLRVLKRSQYTLRTSHSDLPKRYFNLYSYCIKHNAAFRIISITLTRVACNKLFFNLPLSIITHQMATYIMGNYKCLEKKEIYYECLCSRSTMKCTNLYTIQLM